MKSLTGLFNDAGCTRVAFYIQSGNIIFTATERLARQIPILISEQISERFGLQVPVVTRTAAELHREARANPFLEAGIEVETLHVAFLAHHPAPTRLAGLDSRRSPPDEFVTVGREIYLRLPNAGARTRLTTAYFDAKLATTSTVRKWRTVLKLVEMTTSLG